MFKALFNPTVQNNYRGRSLPGFIVLLVWVLVGTGCSQMPALMTSTGSNRAGDVLFSDDFSSPPGGWGMWNRDGALVKFHNSGLRIQVNEAQYDFWSVAGKNFGDVQVTVDATKIGGPDDNDMGIICRYKDKDNFYMLLVSSDGYYGIAKMEAGQYRMIGLDQLQYSESIAKGQTVNQIQATCQGSSLKLSVNGLPLMEAQDSDIVTGDVGVMAGSYNIQGVDILFDNFVVKKP